MEPFIGQIMAVGFNFPPRGWALCEGQLLSISENSALFSLLGTIYGGDGRTTFALPDLRGRHILGVGIGAGLSPIRLGERSGNETTTLIPQNLPSHNHPIIVSSSNATQSAATTGASIGTPGIGTGRSFQATEGFNSGTPNTQLNSATCGNSGENTSFSNRSPFLGMYYVIALQGIYPSRS